MKKAAGKEPVKEISEENRKLAEEFERAVDLKVGELGEEDTFDVIPVEHRPCTVSDSGAFTVEIPVGAGVRQEEISMTLKGRILIINVTQEKEEGTTEIGKMLTLPENVDLAAITSELTSEGNLKIQVPLAKGAEPGQNLNMTASATLALELHNEHRKKHGVGSLKLNPDLCKLAEQYVEALSTKTAVNLDESSLGRNVFEESSDDETETVRRAVSAWYENQKSYNWQEPLSSPKEAQSFVEIIFKATGIFGVGVAKKEKFIYVVALYSRTGSVLKTEKGHKENVRPSTD